MQIKILITGGTFDKEYNELTGQLFFKDTHLPEMLRLGRCNIDLSVETLMMIDSLDMKDEQRERSQLFVKKQKRSTSLSPMVLIRCRKPQNIFATK